VTKQSPGAGDRDCHAALATTQETIATVSKIHSIPWSVTHLSELGQQRSTFGTQESIFYAEGMRKCFN
jgi:hypothetical protein